MDYDFEEDEAGKLYLHEIGAYANFVDSIKEAHAFLSSFSFMQFGRDTVFTRLSIVLSPSQILDSAERTLHSLFLSGEYGHFADINILLRKYRDDVFFYIYLVMIGTQGTYMSEKDRNQHEKQIKDWQENTLSDVFIGDILRLIGRHPSVLNASSKYNMKSAFDAIGDILNKYVHGNGTKYYNQNPSSYPRNEIEEFAIIAGEHIVYITMSFVFILGLLTPLSLMSTDYIDFLDCGENPPTDSQYWVAPFISDYMRKYEHLLGDDCIRYLRNETNMEI